MATITSSPLLTCEGCGKQTSRLYGADHCAVCHLGRLAADEQDACTQLDMIGEVVRCAVAHSCVHPDDIREEIEQVLRDPDAAERTAVCTRLATVRDERRTHAQLLRSEVS